MGWPGLGQRAQANAPIVSHRFNQLLPGFVGDGAFLAQQVEPEGCLVAVFFERLADNQRAPRFDRDPGSEMTAHGPAGLLRIALQKRHARLDNREARAGQGRRRDLNERRRVIDLAHAVEPVEALGDQTLADDQSARGNGAGQQKADRQIAQGRRAVLKRQLRQQAGYRGTAATIPQRCAETAFVVVEHTYGIGIETIEVLDPHATARCGPAFGRRTLGLSLGAELHRGAALGQRGTGAG